MTPKERVYKVIAHEETDIVPYNIPIHPRAHEGLVKVYGEGYNKHILNHIAFSGPLARLFPTEDAYVDAAKLARTLDKANLPRECIENYIAVPGKPWVDEFGCVWQPSSDGAPHIVKHVLTEPSLEGYKFPDLSSPERYKHIPKEIEANKDKFFVAGAGFLFFERAWAMRGLEQILIDFYRNPDFVEELLDNLMELNFQMIEGVTQYDIDAVLFSDDYGMQKGLIMDPKIWRKFLKPRLKRMYRKVKKAGKLVMIHSCGDNSEIMGDLIEMGVDIFNPTQPEAMDIYELKRKWGTQITFNGGITTQKLPFYTPKQIREEVRKVRSFMSKGGGFILEPTKEIRWDVPPETAMALIREIINQNKDRSIIWR